MAEFRAPERATSSVRDRSLRTLVPRGLRISAVCFGVVFGAYAAQKLQTPLGLDDNGDTTLFWAFSLAVMTLLAFALVAVALLVRAIAARSADQPLGRCDQHAVTIREPAAVGAAVAQCIVGVA